MWRASRRSRSGRLRSRNVAIVAAALVAVLLPACDPPPPHVEVEVTDVGTAPDAAPGDGVCEATPGNGDCTLRAAIEETNAQPSADVVTIAEGIDPTPGGAVPITGSLEIRGGGATLGERIVHTAGALTLRHLTITGARGATTCGGGIASTGDSVALDHVVVRDNQTAALSGAGVCASGDVVAVDSTITANFITATPGTGAGVAASGDLVLVRSRVERNGDWSGIRGNQAAVFGTGSVLVVASTIIATRGGSALQAGAASGRIVASTLDGMVVLNAGITVSASWVARCQVGNEPTSGGFNVVGDASCPGLASDRIEVDAAVDASGVPQAWSPLVDGIPAGTTGLCPGPLPTDLSGGERPLFSACDVGALELPSRVRSTRPTRVGAFDGTFGPWDVFAINDAGVTVGTSLSIGPTWTYHATRWAADGTPTIISSSASDAFGVSSDGTVVGSWTPLGAVGRSAFAWDPTTEVLTDLGRLPGDTSASGLDVEAGWAVGTSQGPAGTRPWAASAATGMVELPTFGGPTGAAVAVNGSGLAVGWATTLDGERHAALWDLAAGTVTDIGAGAAPHGSEAVDIAEDGRVVGTVHRPDLGEDCSEPGGGPPPCPFSRPFRWDPTSGTLTQVDGLVGPVAAAAFGPDGTIVEVLSRNVFACAGCPKVTDETYVYDPATGDHVLIAASGYFKAVDANSAGVVVGNDITGDQPGAFFPEPRRVTVSLAG